MEIKFTHSDLKWAEDLAAQKEAQGRGEPTEEQKRKVVERRAAELGVDPDSEAMQKAKVTADLTFKLLRLAETADATDHALLALSTAFATLVAEAGKPGHELELYDTLSKLARLYVENHQK
jgi:hypothetical protein